MRIPTAKSILDGLRAWREERGKSRGEIREHGNRKRVLNYKGDQQIARYENGDAFPALDILIDGLFPAYEIHSLDRFILGYCHPRLHGLSEVRHLRQGNEKEIVPMKRYDGTIRYGVSDTDFLGRVPIRVDRFIIPRGTKSATIWHSGYNYLLVTKGRVCCYLEEEETGIHEAKVLETGEALLFPTTLWHSIEAIGEEDAAEFIVATPHWAHDDLKRKQPSEEKVA